MPFVRRFDTFSSNVRRVFVMMVRLRKLAVLTACVAVLATLFACGQQAEKVEQKVESAVDVNVRQRLVEQSTLEEILQRGELRVGFEAGYVPFEMTDKNGNFVGFDVDMAKEMAKAMGVKFVPVNTAWDGIIPSLLSKKFDVIMSGMTMNSERNLKINFASPYIIAGQAILLNKKWEGQVKSYKDLNKAKFTVTSKLGTTGEQAVKRMIPKATYKSFETETEAFLEVLNGRADAYVYDLPNCIYLYAQQGKGKVVFLDKPFTYEPLAWAIRKGDPDFLNWLNNFLELCKNDGRYDRIYNKWITGTEWMKTIQE